MKRILCYGDSNTWGTAPMKSIDDVRRWGPNERWPCVMASAPVRGWASGLWYRTSTNETGLVLRRSCPVQALVQMLGVSRTFEMGRDRIGGLELQNGCS